jgi:hypothetical protein
MGKGYVPGRTITRPYNGAPRLSVSHGATPASLISLALV